MNKMPSSVVRAVASLLALLAMAAHPQTAEAQSFEALGTRASGMGGAFVAVADDASAVYWNPAGLATSGRLFSLSVDFNQGHADPATTAADAEGDRTASLVAIGTPPLGVSYYRLTATRATPDGTDIQLRNLVTHNAGITVVQSVIGRVAIGTTLRFVRGVVASAATGNDDDLLDQARDLPGASRNTFDTDVGLMAVLGRFRAGLTVRNLREPEFETAGGEIVEMKRQSRAGVTYVGVPGLIVAADMDLERTAGSIGDERNFAAGVEAHLFPRAFLRAGVRINTEDASRAGRASGHTNVYTLGTSLITVRSLLVDAQVTLGSKAGDRGWGIAGRMVY